ncbi:SMC family ATPase [Zhihengliuella sp.]|uniref:SMC family ATPase n=1 Tax=Zhihengliuella sp. TaxID=1954483 RepID=UPI0028114F07|nr:SMC family ATPase [Zhihengliuella sp.]
MRIHRVVIQAFGPFKDREDIDFEALSAGGLFLLNGDTGSGKTTILDAICYALYGSLPGAREKARSIRSAYADDSTPPEVLCEFSIGGRRFEAMRSPAWDRPKARGTGTTRQQAQSSLREFLDGQWTTLSARNDEVGQLVKGLIHLGREEFTRVAMLPQGEFASFLRADDRDRAELLQKLFDVTTYRRVEDLLAERRRELARRAESAERNKRTLTSRLVHDSAENLLEAGADGDEPAGPAAGGARPPAETLAEWHAALSDYPDDAPLPEPRALAETVAELLRARTDEADQRDEAARVGLAAARERVGEVRRRRDDAARLVELERERELHEDQRPGIVETRERLDQHERGTRVERAERRYLAARSRLAQARQLLRSAEADARGVAGLAEVLTAERPVAADLGQACRAAVDLVSRLEALRGREAELAEVKQKLGSARDRQAELERQRAATARELSEERARLETVEAELKGLRASAHDLARQEEVVAAARRRLEAVTARDAFAADLRQRVETWLEAEDELLRRRAIRAQLVRDRLEQSAAVLAAELVDGQPCAVCGSEAHPAPAAPSGASAVTDAELEAAEAAAEDAQRREREAAAAKATAERDMARLSAEAADLDPDAASAALAEAEESARQARETAARIVRLEADAVSGSQACQALDAEDRRSEQEAGVLAATVEESTARAARLEAELAEAVAPAATLEDRLSSVRGVCRALEAWRDAADAVSNVVEAAEEAGQGLRETLTEQDFLSAEASDDGAGLDEAIHAAALARLATDEAEVLRRGVREFDEREIRLNTLAESDAVARAFRARASGEPVPDDAELAGAEAAAQTAEVHRAALAESRGALLSYGRRFTADLDALDQLVADQGSLLEEYELVRGLADTVAGAGENTLKMTLSTYVLAARLEAVAAAATERLSIMTGGRFELRHTDASGGRGKGGLGISVVDEWNGQTREPSTLSGGETFMASLALALGLADVIQAESGGIDMETLFVDEGFGTLDPGTLELVMRSLDDLRSSGRVVGVISHVQELKSQIATQLVVHKHREGSSTSLQTDAVTVR